MAQAASYLASTRRLRFGAIERLYAKFIDQPALNSRGGCPVIRLNTREKAAALS